MTPVIGARRPLITALLALAVAGCGETTAGRTTSTPAVQHHAQAAHAKRRAAVSAATGAAAAALAQLAVKGRAPKTGYSRERFGDGWIDTEGCDTRDRILTRDLTAKTYLDACHVESGGLADPYTAARIHFRRGGASEVDIDHVVALSDAWQKGAQRWPASTRIAFANDPLNLLASDAHSNRAKGDGDAATWLPPNKPFRCAYVARQVAVKRKYKLSVTAAEKDAISRVLATCPGQKLPRRGRRIPVTVSHHGYAYANCTEARAAGVTPIRRGTPVYAANPRLDRDHDGVACES